MGVLESGAVFKLYYPNYSSFMSTSQSLPKRGTSRFNLSIQSLDMVLSTFQVQDRGTQQAPILGLWGANGVGSFLVIDHLLQLLLDYQQHYRQRVNLVLKLNHSLLV